MKNYNKDLRKIITGGGNNQGKGTEVTEVGMFLVGPRNLNLDEGQEGSSRKQLHYTLGLRL